MADKTITITLDTPITLGETQITSVELRKPMAGELRGITMSALTASDYAALETLLPRITTPTLHKAMIATMDPADLLQMAGEVVGFLLPKSARADLPST